MPQSENKGCWYWTGDFNCHRSGKGDKDRRTVLPESLKDSLTRHIAETQGYFMMLIEKKASVAFICLTLLRKNIRMPEKNGDGFGRFHQGQFLLILALMLSAVIICTQLRFKRHLNQLQQKQESQSSHQLIHLDTVSQHICYKMDMTLGQCRSFSATATYRRPWFTPMW